MTNREQNLGLSPKGAGTLLLKRMPDASYVAACTAQIADEKTSAARAGTKAMVIFRIGKEWLGLPAELLQEIVELFEIRTLPHQRGSSVKGLVNIRGELLVCISLPVLLGIERGDASLTDLPPRRHLLVLNREGGRFVFEADEVRQTHRYHPSELSAPPATLLKSLDSHLIEAILPWNEHIVGCLAIGELRRALDQRLK